MKKLSSILIITGLLGIGLSIGFAEEKRSHVYASDKEIKPLAVGEKIPANMSVKNSKGEDVNLADFSRGTTTVLVFYRGGWCPYCNTHLAELSKFKDKFDSESINVFGLSPDSPETIASYYENHDVEIPLLSDSEHHAMSAMGIAFYVDEPTQDFLRGYGIDLEAASGNSSAVLPVPAIFVVDPEGTITFVHADAEYRNRLDTEELMKQLEI